MTLDRRDYNTAIPQLEKRLEAVESVGDKSLADLDVLSSLLEKESLERERLYLKNVTQIQAVQATANGKNKIFRQSSQPTSGMADGDIWFDTSNDNKISRYNGSSWVAFTLGDDALDSLSASKLTAGTIDASVITVSNLDAGNITTGTLDASHIDASSLTIGGSPLATQSDIPTKVSDLLNDKNFTTVYNATCSTAAATAAKEATTTEGNFALVQGVTVNVIFSTTNSTNTAITLDVDGTGAKPIKYINNTGYSNIPSAGYIVANLNYQFVYDGTNWVIQNLNYNSNDVDRHRINNNLKSGSVAITRNSICGYSHDASGWISLASAQSNSYKIDLSYPIVYLNSSSTLNASTNSTNFYDAYPSITLSYTKSGWNVTPYHKELYVKGTLDGRLLTLHSDLITTTVPTTKDGLAYIPIGYTYSTTAANFNYKDTVYAYKGGKFQEVGYGYANSHITEIGSDGIKVHDDNDTTNYVLIDSNGMDVVKSNTSVAFYGDYARVGKESESKVLVYPTDITMTNQQGAETFRVRSLDKTRSRRIYKNIGYWLSQGASETLDISTIMASITNGTTFYLDVIANESPEADELSFVKGTTATKSASYGGGALDITYNGSTHKFTVDNTSSSNTSSVLAISWVKSTTWSRVEVDQIPLDYVIDQGHDTNGWDYVLWASGKAEAWLVVTWTGKLATSNGGWYSTNESDGITTANMPNEIFVYPNNDGQPIYRNVTVYQDLHGLSAAKNNVIPLLYNTENDYSNRYFGDVQLARGNSNSSNYTYVINCHVFIPPKSNWQDYI